MRLVRQRQNTIIQHISTPSSYVVVAPKRWSACCIKALHGFFAETHCQFRLVRVRHLDLPHLPHPFGGSLPLSLCSSGSACFSLPPSLPPSSWLRLGSTSPQEAMRRSGKSGACETWGTAHGPGPSGSPPAGLAGLRRLQGLSVSVFLFCWSVGLEGGFQGGALGLSYMDTELFVQSVHIGSILVGSVL